MGKKMDALLRRNFRTAKFKNLVNLAISRLSILKNQRKVRSSQARSDVAQLLSLGDQDRALLRVEVVTKEQNMLDALVMIEGYCHTMLERIFLIENNKECPDEIKEAAASLSFAASRCGDFPELLEIRSVIASQFGKEFVARAVELRNTCGVNPKMIRKLSPRLPSYESRIKVLREIASQNGFTLNIEEDESATVKENLELNPKQKQPEGNTRTNFSDAEIGAQGNKWVEEVDPEQISGSQETRNSYSDVATAAQAAFESAAYAAAAARAAVELSRSQSQSSAAPRRRKWPFHRSSTSNRDVVGTGRG